MLPTLLDLPVGDTVHRYGGSTLAVGPGAALGVADRDGRVDHYLAGVRDLDAQRLEGVTLAAVELPDLTRLYPEEDPFSADPDGPDRDDEVNLLRRRGNYGWNPVPGYDESVPMTDPDLPGTVYDAQWSSGRPTIATSGGTFVRGAGWRGYRGALAVAALAGQRLVFM
jgi:hypothetical protein